MMDFDDICNEELMDLDDLKKIKGGRDNIGFAKVEE